MKKIFLILLCISFVSIQAQEQSESDVYSGSHELKVNGLFLVVGAFDVTYEYLLNEESGLGINIFLPYDSEIKDDIQYYISPYYRFYFGKKPAAGFFLEGFGMLNSVESELFTSNDDYVTDFALGIGLGGKWVTKGGFVGELSFGLGRNLFTTNESDIDFVGKIGITLGYRF
ncbi:DUF3575 domain-containing protein [uncultured Winogradskyella sp.]|uniref:DUF3575 domain-containing protein n=1 Tax=uncultured Winogradskyella sp. TaxID=395353 RepID=UPI00260345B0|nr:DUF3575 domain-containing protein [uncultured Winogradskyella sp.]